MRGGGAKQFSSCQLIHQPDTPETSIGLWTLINTSFQKGWAQSPPLRQFSSNANSNRVSRNSLKASSAVIVSSGTGEENALDLRSSDPPDFRQWCHGDVVTSHKARGWTTDHVVVAAETLQQKVPMSVARGEGIPALFIRRTKYASWGACPKGIAKPHWRLSP